MKTIPRDRQNILKKNPRPNKPSDQKQTANQQPEKQSKDARKETFNPKAPKSNLPDYGDRPEQNPIIEDEEDGNASGQETNRSAVGRKQTTSGE